MHSIDYDRTSYKALRVKLAVALEKNAEPGWGEYLQQGASQAGEYAGKAWDAVKGYAGQAKDTISDYAGKARDAVATPEQQASISGFLSRPDVQYAGLGALGGGALGALSSLTQEKKKRSPIRRALIGALLGGVGGYGAYAAGKGTNYVGESIKEPIPPGWDGAGTGVPKKDNNGTVIPPRDITAKDYAEAQRLTDQKDTKRIAEGTTKVSPGEQNPDWLERVGANFGFKTDPKSVEVLKDEKGQPLRTADNSLAIDDSGKKYKWDPSTTHFWDTAMSYPGETAAIAGIGGSIPWVGKPIVDTLAGGVNKATAVAGNLIDKLRFRNATLLEAKNLQDGIFFDNPAKPEVAKAIDDVFAEGKDLGKNQRQTNKKIERFGAKTNANPGGGVTTDVFAKERANKAQQARQVVKERANAAEVAKEVHPVGHGEYAVQSPKAKTTPVDPAQQRVMDMFDVKTPPTSTPAPYVGRTPPTEPAPAPTPAPVTPAKATPSAASTVKVNPLVNPHVRPDGSTVRISRRTGKPNIKPAPKATTATTAAAHPTKMGIKGKSVAALITTLAALAAQQAAHGYMGIKPKGQIESEGNERLQEQAAAQVMEAWNKAKLKTDN